MKAIAASQMGSIWQHIPYLDHEEGQRRPTHDVCSAHQGLGHVGYTLVPHVHGALVWQLSLLKPESILY